MEITINNPFQLGFYTTLGASFASLIVYALYLILKANPIGIVFILAVAWYCYLRETRKPEEV
jgi:hypothetical protein